MITDLFPCPSCARHVRRRERACPFCSVSVMAAAEAAPVRCSARVRLGRAATFVLGAALGGQVVGCSHSMVRSDAGPAETDAPADDVGAPGADAGPPSADGGARDAGLRSDASGDGGALGDADLLGDAGADFDAAIDAGDIPIYGGPPAP